MHIKIHISGRYLQQTRHVLLAGLFSRYHSTKLALLSCTKMLTRGGLALLGIANAVHFSSGFLLTSGLAVAGR